METWHANCAEILRKNWEILRYLNPKTEINENYKKSIKMRQYHNGKRDLITNYLWNYKKNCIVVMNSEHSVRQEQLRWITKTDLMEFLLPLDILYIQLVVNVTINFGCDLLTEICSQWQKNARKYRDFFALIKVGFSKAIFEYVLSTLFWL